MHGTATFFLTFFSPSPRSSTPPASLCLSSPLLRPSHFWLPPSLRCVALPLGSCLPRSLFSSFCTQKIFWSPPPSCWQHLRCHSQGMHEWLLLAMSSLTTDGLLVITQCLACACSDPRPPLPTPPPTPLPQREKHGPWRLLPGLPKEPPQADLDILFSLHHFCSFCTSWQSGSARLDWKGARFRVEGLFVLM